MEVNSQRKLTCPVCGGEMKTISRYDVEIDVCKACKGVWLDRGELNKIVESVSSIYDHLIGVVPDDLAYHLNKPDEAKDLSEDKNYLKKVFEIDNI